MDSKKKIELLCPAGGLETLKCAVDYGADAVYIGGQHFSLRAKADNFSKEDMIEAVKYAHSHNAKVYVTVNIFAHNRRGYPRSHSAKNLPPFCVFIKIYAKI